MHSCAKPHKEVTGSPPGKGVVEWTSPMHHYLLFDCCVVLVAPGVESHMKWVNIEYEQTVSPNGLLDYVLPERKMLAEWPVLGHPEVHVVHVIDGQLQIPMDDETE